MFQYCSDTVALAWTAALTSSIRVPPSYMRNSPSEGVSNWSEASERIVYSTPIASSRRFSSRLLPTQKPSKPGMMLIVLFGVRSAPFQKLSRMPLIATS